jgi:pimeloyl-ACP methyl ester carboxylesterase
MKHHIIYVPGLGDHRTWAQRLAPKYWEVFGITGHVFVMNWRDKEAFAPKLERLLRMIDELSTNGDKVSLVGTSAGASAVLNAYTARLDKVAGVVCICGKINNPSVHSPRYIENPAFKESLMELQRILPKLGPKARARIMSIRPLVDESVPPADTIIPGARALVIPTIGHAFSIATALIFAAYTMVKFLKKQATSNTRG